MIGLLVGIEREKSHSSQQALGIRTFLFISLLGALAGGIPNLWLSALICLFSFSLIAISYFNQTKNKTNRTDFGLTTEFAAGLVFCLSYLAHETPLIAAIAGPIVAVVLFSKSVLHRFIKAISPSELQAALLLFLSGVVVLNLLPEKTIDPWGFFNPKKFGFLVLVLATLEFLSYVFSKVIGAKKGLLVLGFLGGFVSSTAVLLSSAKKSELEPQNWRTLLCSAIAAKFAALVELLLIVYLISPALIFKLLLPIGLALLICTVFIMIFANHKTEAPSHYSIKSPLDWKGVFRLSIVFTIILALISFAKLGFGDNASMAVSFLTALFELHGVSLANATLFSQNQIDIRAASINMFLAVNASLLAKIIMSWAVCRGPFSKALTLVFSMMILLISSTAYFMFF